MTIHEINKNLIIQWESASIGISISFCVIAIIMSSFMTLSQAQVPKLEVAIKVTQSSLKVHSTVTQSLFKVHSKVTQSLC